MLRIEIVPWFYSGSPDIELRIRVTPAKGETISYNKVLQHDEFLSWWERIMDEAKLIIKEHYLTSLDEEEK